MAIKESGSLYKLLDGPATPDVYHTSDYESRYRNTATPLIIDNGSSECRAGWAGEEQPRLVFRNAIARTRGKKGEADCVCIGNDITHVEAVRSTLKNQFDRNIVANFTYQEQVLDHILSHLGLEGEGCVSHPVVMTEAVCNPTYSRSQITELLFECYGVPSVAYGVDALFSTYYNFSKKGRSFQDALIISSGHQTTYVLPVLQGMLDSTHCKRVNLGGMQTAGFLQRLLQLKYPDLQTHITLSRTKEILHHHSYLALDYGEELKIWTTPTRQSQLDYRYVQLPFNQAMVGAVVTDVSRELKDKQRRQRARQQLLKLNKKKREEKIASLLKELGQHLEVKSQQGTMDPEEYQLLLEDNGHDSEESLAGAVQQLEAQLETEQEKLATLVKNLSMDGTGGGLQKQQQQEEEHVSEEWLQSLKQRRKEILESKRQRHLKKVELGKRRSAASQNRMRIISSLGAEVTAKKGKRNKEDTFGMDDEDWNVYRAIDKHAEDSDSEKEENELMDIIKVLEKHDPSYMRGSAHTQASHVDMAASYQLVLGVERFRVPEIIFQPPMVGMDQCGLSETIEFVLQYYPPEVQQRLVQSVFITGGNTLHENFSQRVEVDLRSIRPFESCFQISCAQDPLLDTWRGEGLWATQPANQNAFITRAEYLEKGSEFMKEHVTSNAMLILNSAL